MGLTIQHPNPALSPVGRALCASRDELVRHWCDWIGHQRGQAPQIDRPTVQRQLTLLIDIMVELSGPLRRHVLVIWLEACEFYGETAATRGLAAGEVVEEVQHLRELLIRHLSEFLAALPARQAMASILRLNRLLDRGTAQAVVGYTDALVETLFNQRGVPMFVPGSPDAGVVKRLEQFEGELERWRDKTLTR